MSLSVLYLLSTAKQELSRSYLFELRGCECGRALGVWGERARVRREACSGSGGGHVLLCWGQERRGARRPQYHQSGTYLRCAYANTAGVGTSDVFDAAGCVISSSSPNGDMDEL